MLQEVMGSGAARLGMCKVMGQWYEGKCASPWVSRARGKMRRNKEMVQNVEISLRPHQCGQLYAGGHPS